MNEQGPQGIELRQVLAVLGKWRWIIIVLTGVATLTAAVLGEFVLPKVYQAQSTVDVSYAAPAQSQQQANASQGIQGVLQAEAMLPQNTLETYQFEVTNPSVLDATVKALQAKGVSMTPDALSKMVNVSAVTNTNLINVDASATSPTEAALVANTLTASFLQFVQEQDQTKLNQAVGFLQQQTTGVQQQLSSATSALAQAETKDGNTEASSQLTADTSELNTLQDQLVQAQVSLQSAQAGETALEQQLASTPPTVAKTTTGTSSSAASAQNSGASTSAATQRSQTPQGADEPNPVYQALSQQLAIQKVTVAEDQATVSELQGQISTLFGQIRTLSQQVQSAQGTIQSLQATVQELTTTYQTLSENLVQTQVADSVSLGSAVVTQVATALPPAVPIKPKKKLDVALAFILGLVVSVTLAFVLDQMDTTLKTAEDVERLVHLPTLAVIPHVLD